MKRGPSHKSHNASDKYPIVHHFVTKICTYIFVTKCCIMGYRSGAVWDLCNRPRFVQVCGRFIQVVALYKGVGTYSFTQWGWDKMAAILHTHFQVHFLDTKYLGYKYVIKIWLMIVVKGPIDTICALVQVMACRLTGDKPLHEPMMTQVRFGISDQSDILRIIFTSDSCLI